MAGGAAATYFGAPQIGIPLMMGGAGQMIGKGAGGDKGSSLGELSGLGAGFGGEGLVGMGPLSGALGGAGSSMGLPQFPGMTGTGIGGLDKLGSLANTPVGSQVVGAGLNKAMQSPQTPAPQAVMQPRPAQPPPQPMSVQPAVQQVAGASGQQSPQLQRLLALLQGGGTGMA